MLLAASYQVNAVDLQPSNVVPPGGQLSIAVDGLNTQQVTAGDATVTVWYFGVQVLSAGDTLCGSGTPAAAATAQNSIASSRKLKGVSSTSRSRASQRNWLQHQGQSQQQSSAGGVSDGSTCTLAAGPLHLTHTATLPGIAPRGRYSMRLAASDMVTGLQIMCLDVWFMVG